ncbi:SAM-dependent methyltransferase [Cereibacter sphaeroides]|uniref:acetylserotonin O-methyltransferase n=1 Tax=Cereibacter sphaeroides TaxID=1063 RepID=UPI001F2DBDF2|nr:acetylserotonin O-methyltransferase [Cereibacter sphaeroides]MCE6950886.1 SAM-dependent methyltransferase [Cereibacter sphaeroides]
MSALRPPARGGLGLSRLGLRLAGSRRFQIIAERIPLLRRIGRREGDALFDIVAGFVHSQVLYALVELRVLHMVHDGPQTVQALAARTGLSPERMQLLLQGGAALKLLKRCRDGRFDLAVRGAAFLAVPGLEAMVGHHHVLYRDLADPVAFLKGETDPELARFWPYVFGAAGAVDAEVTAKYSLLMTESQGLVAEDTLRLVDLMGVKRLMDVGGGTGAFLAAVGRAYPLMELMLFDLPIVVAAAPERLAAVGLGGRFTVHGGSFRDDPLPLGADAISLVRILFDHSDETVKLLLSRVFAALPPDGRVIIAEPMSGGAVPHRETDTYMAFYTAAMKTGRTRSAAEIGELLSAQGFTGIKAFPGFRPYVASAVTAVRPSVPG